MGIQGLIPFLEKSSKPSNVKQFSGNTVAIDAYCWLHKGVFSCADKLARGEDCRSYVHYCMKFVNMLLSYNIKPILVFDGQKLPAKRNTEKKRRDLREQSRKKAAELMRMDRGKEALVYLRQSVDVTHEMALNLIQACRLRNVDCIVAPYEADAQLAYLNTQNIAQVIITEDSDLLLFGAKKVLFKMDVNGNGLLVERDCLHVSMGEKPENFSFDKFRYMCILSGCDYLSSLPGIGLAKACRFIKRTVDPDIHRAISRIGSHLNMPSLKVPPEYRDNFMEADFMFKYQPVFDPVKRKLVPLTSVSEDDENYQKFSSLIEVNKLSPDQVCHLAYGNLDPFTLRQLDDWIPGRVNSISGKQTKNKFVVAQAKHPSIWNPEFVPYERKELNHAAPNALKPLKTPTSSNKSVENSSSWFVKPSSDRKVDASDAQDLSEQLQKLKSMYDVNRHEDRDECNDSLMGSQSNSEEIKSQNSSFSDKSSLMNSFSEQDSEKNAAKMKIRSALSKFTRSYKSENSENSSDIVSGYFSSSSTTGGSPVSSVAESPVSTVTDESLWSPKNPDKTNASPKSPIFGVQRSPLKVKNYDDEYHPISPAKAFGSTPIESCNTTAANSSARKRLNPFAVTNSEKIIRADSDEYGQNSDVSLMDSGFHKKETTFKWTKSIANPIPNTFESTNQRWSVDPVTTNFSSPIKFYENDQSVNSKQNETSPILSSTRTNRYRDSLSAPIRSKCRTFGLLKKSNLKQQSLLSSFTCSKPRKLKL